MASNRSATSSMSDFRIEVFLFSKSQFIIFPCSIDNTWMLGIEKVCAHHCKRGREKYYKMLKHWEILCVKRAVALLFIAALLFFSWNLSSRITALGLFLRTHTALQPAWLRDEHNDIFAFRSQVEIMRRKDSSVITIQTKFFWRLLE